MTFSLTQFGENSAFERYVLDEMAPALPRFFGAQIVDYTDDMLRIHAVVSPMPAQATASINGAGQMAAIDITPMVFGAAWKILDVLADAILGKKQNGDPLTIEAKCSQALTGNGPPRQKPFSNEPDLWKRVMHLYGNTMDLRHSVVHRQLVPRNDSNLEATPNLGQTAPATVMTPEELSYFFRMVQGFSAALIAERISTRERLNLAFLINQLHRHHGLVQLAGREITRYVVVLAKPQVSPSGMFEFDARPAMAEARARWPTAAIDLFLFMPDGNVLGGALEDAPTDRPASVNPNSPPRWLDWAPDSEWKKWDHFRSGR